MGGVNNEVGVDDGVVQMIKVVVDNRGSCVAILVKCNVICCYLHLNYEFYIELFRESII